MRLERAMLGRLKVWSAIGILMAVSPLWAQDKAAAPSTGGAQSKVATADPNYVIGGQDVLSISVWKEADLSLPAIPVRPDGKISMPLLNDVQAAGLTPTQLAAQLTES